MSLASGIRCLMSFRIRCTHSSLRQALFPSPHSSSTRETEADVVVFRLPRWFPSGRWRSPSNAEVGRNSGHRFGQIKEESREEELFSKSRQSVSQFSVPVSYTHLRAH